MERGVGRVLAAVAAVLLLLAVGRPAAAVDTPGSLTAASVAHHAVVVALASGPRALAAHPEHRQPALAAATTAPPLPTATGARDTTDGTSRTPAPHLTASTGDRAPPALP